MNLEYTAINILGRLAERRLLAWGRRFNSTHTTYKFQTVKYQRKNSLFGGVEILKKKAASFVLDHHQSSNHIPSRPKFVFLSLFTCDDISWFWFSFCVHGLNRVLAALMAWGLKFADRKRSSSMANSSFKLKHPFGLFSFLLV